MIGSTRLRLLTAIALLAAVVQSAGATELITNGGFEGGLFGWTVRTQPGSSGTLSAAQGTVTPISGSPTPGPASGLVYALTDQNGGGSYSLLQSFTLLPGMTSITYSFDLFANSYGGFSTTNPIRNYLTAPNQNVVVDILRSTADAFTTNPADILATLYGPAVGASGSNAWTLYTGTLNLSAGSYLIRFAETDNQGLLNMGVDNVSIQSSTVPLPAALWLLLSGSGVVGLMRRRPSAETPLGA